LTYFSFSLALIPAYLVRSISLTLSIDPFANTSFTVKVNAATIAIGPLVRILSFIYAVIVLHADDAVAVAMVVKLANDLRVSSAHANWLIRVERSLRVLKYLTQFKRTELIPHFVCLGHATRRRLFVEHLLELVGESLRIQ